MAMKVAANGERIRALRNMSPTELPQKVLATQCQISERQLRRIENENLKVSLPVLQRLAGRFGVDITEIAFGLVGPQLVSGRNSTGKRAAVDDDLGETNIPRHRTALLAPISSARELYSRAADCQQIVPHVLVETGPAQLTMIQECLGILSAVSHRKWSLGPITPDRHDDDEFPDLAREKRLAELFVLLKGHDIRIVADQVIYDYPDEETPWLQGQRFCFQFVVAFVPPRGQYEEDTVTVPFDGGRDHVLPRKPNF